MIIKYSDDMINANPWLFDNIKNRYANSFINYITNSNYRQSVNLRSWISDQITNPSFEAQQIALSIPSGNNHDETVVNVLRWVRDNIVYVPDSDLWRMNENWTTANEILTRWYIRKNGRIELVGTGLKPPVDNAFRADDCEGGATVIVVLCSLKGVPSERLYLTAGDVTEPMTKRVVGHAWASYRPQNYPLNWAFLDWCYDPDLDYIGRRPLYYISDDKITGYKMSGDFVTAEDNTYKDIWFIFNKDKSHSSLVFNYQK